MSLQRFKLVFFSPAPSTRAVLDHLFAQFPAHVGKIGNYEKCAFLSRGTALGGVLRSSSSELAGQFQPSADANPAIGTVGALESVEEDRVEVVVLDRIHDVVQELKAIHPYEEVAYDVYKLENL